jgi:hypothetical protein
LFTRYTVIFLQGGTALKLHDGSQLAFSPWTKQLGCLRVLVNGTIQPIHAMRCNLDELIALPNLTSVTPA